MSTNDVARSLADVLGADLARWHAAWMVRQAHHPPTIRFDRPTDTLSISLTGQSCALDCAHCGGHYLRHMHPIWDVQVDGYSSCLISGGCDAQGRVPVLPHLDRVRALRAGRLLNWHVGFIAEAEAREIAPYADVISFDIVGDAETAREVYGLEAALDDYMRSLDMLRRYAPVVPHITIGLRAGRLSGEYAALEALRSRDLDRLIFIVLIPTEGTAYARCAPPALQDVADVLLEARIALPRTRLYLGCMRPHGVYRQAVDELAVRAGLNVVVNPTRRAIEVAGALGLTADWGQVCCALN